MPNFLRKAGKLRQGLCSSRLAHPIQLLKAVAENTFKCFYEFVHAGSRSGGEMSFNKQFAQCLPDFSINDPGGALPPWLLYLLVAKDFAVEGERFILGGSMEIWGRLAQNVPTQIDFPVVQGFLS